MHIYIKILLFLIFIDFSWDLLNSSNNFKRSNSFKIGVVLATILIFLNTNRLPDYNQYNLQDILAGFFLVVLAGFLFHNISSYIKSYKVN